MKVNEIYNIQDLDKLEKFLNKYENNDEIREILFSEFLKYADYKNVSDWNKSVKLCECLAIVGWGNYEPLEALRGMFFNGNPMTYYLNKFGKPRFVDAIWSKRKLGFTMEQGRTSFHCSPNQIDDKETILWFYESKEDIQDIKIESQRNWIPKNPIWFDRGISNCYENSKDVIESIVSDLQITLNEKMRPEKYGRAINRIIVNCSFSYFDNAHCKTNYIIAKTDKKISTQKAYEELQKMFSKNEISENGYFLRNRFEYGRLMSKTGILKANIHFEKEFSELTQKEQKEKFTEYALMILNEIIKRLKKKKLNYDFDLMLKDFEEIIGEWKK